MANHPSSARKLHDKVSIFLAWYHTDQEKLLEWKKWLRNLPTRKFEIISSHDILPGRKWEQEIEDAIRRSDLFVPFLSLRDCYAYYNEPKPKEDPDPFIFRREIEIALEIATDQNDPRYSYFVAPAYLENPDGFSRAGRGRLRCLAQFNDIQLFKPSTGRRQLVDAITNTSHRISPTTKRRVLEAAGQ